MSSDTIWDGSGSSSKSATSTVTCSTPAVTSVSASLSSTNLTIPKTSTGTATTTVTSYALDQYGFRLATSKAGTPTVTVDYTTGTTVGTPNTSGDTDSTAITVKRGARMAGNTNTKTVTVTVKYGSKSTTKTYTLTDPTYTYTYDKNGGTSLNATITSFSAYYGQSANNVSKSFPTNGDYVGFEFIGMYADQKTPSYAVTKPTAGTTSGYTGNVTASTALQYDDDTTLYAAWWSKNVKVTYINNDGSIIKESSYGKVDQKASYIPSGIPSGAANPTKPADPTYVPIPGVAGTFSYVFDHWEVASAKQYTTANSDTQADYSSIVGMDYDTAPLKGDTVFVAVYRIASTNTYSITYKNASQSNTVSTYHYKDEGKTGSYATATLPAADAENNKYTYEFLGWAQQVNSNDTVYWQDWDADLGAYVPENNAQTPLTDTKVYHDATWVAVYGRKYIDYTVTFNFVGVTTDETGAASYDAGNKIEVTKHYDELIQIPAPQSYTGGKLSGTAPAGASYSNSTGYTYDFNAWNPALSGDEVAVAALSGWTGSANAKTKTFNATYTAVPAKYRIYFVAPDTAAGADGIQHAQYSAEDGSLLTKVLNGTTEFSHGASVNNAKNQAEAAVVRTYRDNDNEYTFTGWAPTYASTATDNVTYTAQYDVSPLYTVTYEDENGELGTWKGTTSEYIPLMPEGIGTPEKADDLYATDYTFSGWDETPYNAKNPVTPAINTAGTRNMTVPEGGTTVYAQFDRTPINYEINFIYGNPVDGVMPDHKQTLEYGENVIIPSGDTVKRDSDETYNYEFSGWDNDPSATVKGNATYTANYRKSYVYYDVTWLYQNGELDPDTGKNFRVEKYIYGERIRAPFSTPDIRITDPAEDPLLPALGANCEYAFDQWVLAKKVNGVWTAQRDANDELIPFNNSTYIETGVEYGYLPTYKSVAALRTLTILDTDDTVLGTMQIGIGETILANVEDPEAKNPDANNHYAFDGWVYVADDSNTYAANAGVADSDTMVGNITIKATYAPEAHTYKFFETKTAPTFDATGVATFVCEAEGCGHTHDVTLPKLTDDVLPGIRLYVKNSLWDSTSPDPSLTELDDTVIPVAPDSLLIANGTDKANVTTYYINKADLTVKTALEEGDNAADYAEVTYNADEKGSGVNEIWAYYTEAGEHLNLAGLAAVANSTDSNPDGWHQIYARMSPTEEANHSDVFASFEPAVQDGHQYVVYLKAIDAKGNVNYVSSAKVGYDTTAPTITLTGDGNEARTKFCLDATIVLDEADLTVLLDGNPIEVVANTVTDPETEATTYEYTVDAVGKHTIRVIDAAGNETMKAFQIIGEHRAATTYKAATCTEDGWEKNICILCDKQLGEETIYPASGHTYQTKTKRATCTEAGYTQEICSKCGDEKEQVLVPALGHTWNAGEIKKQPNCTQNGTILYMCTRCGEMDAISGDVLDVTADGYNAADAQAVLEAHPDLAGDAEEPVQATDAFGNPLYVQKTDPETGDPLFTDTVATDANGKTIYNKDGSPAYLPDYDTTQPIYSYPIVHNHADHSFKVEKQTKAPTCTEAGEITQECRYCGLKFHVRDVEALGHDWTADPDDETAWTVVPDHDATCTAAGAKYPSVCATCGAANTEMEGQVEIPALGHNYEESGREEPYKDESDVWHNGYVEYTCTRCGDSYQETLLPEVEYTYIFKVDGATVATVTKHPGEQITLDEVPTATKETTNDTRYIFDKWVNADNAEVTFPMIISQETGDQTFTAIFREETVYYTISFFEEDGTTPYVESGFKTYGTEFVQVGPEKPQDETYVYTFEGWVKLDAEPDAEPITTIKVLGNESYKAVYSKVARTYTVAWVIDGEAVKIETVTAGVTLQALYDAHPADCATKNPTKTFDDKYHYTFTSWNVAFSTPVSGDMQVVARFQKETHHTVQSGDSTEPTCTEPGTNIYRCSGCDYYYTKPNGKALGHDFSLVTEYVPATPDTNGHKTLQCSRCDETKTIELVYNAIRLEITVKNSNHEPVSGAKVSVYDGNTLIGSAMTGVDGVAVVYVPEAKEYTIVIEGAEFTKVTGKITVDENGNIVGGAVPVPSAAATCECTCHRKGLWPTIFRFYHKLVKILTGKYHCCADANY